MHKPSMTSNYWCSRDTKFEEYKEYENLPSYVDDNIGLYLAKHDLEKSELTDSDGERSLDNSSENSSPVGRVSYQERHKYLPCLPSERHMQDLSVGV